MWRSIPKLSPVEPQHILDDGGELCCEAALAVGLFDLAARKLIPPTPEWLAALGLRAEDLG